MFGIAEFLQDYSKDPKYRAVWQASSSTDTYLEPIEGNEEGTITSVEELTKNVGDLICGRDLRGVVAQRVSNSEVFRVSAELSSRLFLGVMHMLNDQVDSFKSRSM
uniref:START domain-containing protein n=1 Tax=Steinernema glaseri TaxID=37863 RepID=A0A1I7YEY3_9BILA